MIWKSYSNVEMAPSSLQISLLGESINFQLDSQSKSAKGNPTESKFTFILALPVWGRGEEEGSTPSPGWFGALTLFKKHVDVTRGLLMKKVRKSTR